MAKKKDILERTPDFGTSFFDVLSKFDISNTNKFVDMLSRIFQNKFKCIEEKGISDDRSMKIYEFISELTVVEHRIFDVFMTLLDVHSYSDMNTILEFMYLIESKALKDNDINNYNSIEDVIFAVKNHESEKLKVKSWEYRKIFEDERFLMITPFTLEASQKYGSGTKWCTTSPSETFYNYIAESILIYIIDKKTNNKIAAHKPMYNNPEETGFWNPKDVRVDSFFTGLPPYILSKIINIMRDETIRTNYDFMSAQVIDKVKERENILRQGLIKEKEGNYIPPPQVMHMPDPYEGGRANIELNMSEDDIMNIEDLNSDFALNAEAELTRILNEELRMELAKGLMKGLQNSDDNGEV